jgi:hypothetical protein
MTLVEIRCAETRRLLGTLRRDNGRLVIEGQYRDPDASMHRDVAGDLRASHTYWNHRYRLDLDPRSARPGEQVVRLLGCLDKAEHEHLLDTTLLAEDLTAAERNGKVRTLLLTAD